MSLTSLPPRPLKLSQTTALSHTLNLTSASAAKMDRFLVSSRPSRSPFSAVARNSSCSPIPLINLLPNFCTQRLLKPSTPLFPLYHLIGSAL